MRRLRNSVLPAVVAIAALAQTASEKPSVDVLRVAHRLACMCGCNDTIATCSMLECHFSKPAKLRIAKLQGEGMSDQAIIDLFVQENGPGIYRAEPNAWGWIIPYAAVGLGLIMIWLVLRRYYKPRPVADLGPLPEDPALAKYNEQIEKDLARLD